MTRRSWTLPELRRARKRQHAGETAAQIAADLGCTPGALRAALIKHTPGEGPGRRAPHNRRNTRSAERRKMYIAAHDLHRARRDLTWKQIADMLDYPHTPKGLANAVGRYRAAIGLLPASGEPVETPLPEFRGASTERLYQAIVDAGESPHAPDGWVSMSQVNQAAGEPFPNSTAHRGVDELVEHGLIESRGQMRARRYRAAVHIPSEAP